MWQRIGWKFLVSFIVSQFNGFFSDLEYGEGTDNQNRLSNRQIHAVQVAFLDPALTTIAPAPAQGWHPGLSEKELKGEMRDTNTIRYNKTICTGIFRYTCIRASFRWTLLQLVAAIHPKLPGHCSESMLSSVKLKLHLIDYWGMHSFWACTASYHKIIRTRWQGWYEMLQRWLLQNVHKWRKPSILSFSTGPGWMACIGSTNA